MLKHALTTTAFAALMLSSALAQSVPPAPNTSTPMPAPSPMAPAPSTMAPAPSPMAPAPTAMVPQSPVSEPFLRQQNRADWRASKLIGTNVMGPDNAKIGDINDVVIDSNGVVHAIVIGIGGVLGLGEKDVAISPKSLVIKQSATGDKIEKLSVSFTLDQLKNAPEFKWVQAPLVSTSDKRSDILPRN